MIEILNCSYLIFFLLVFFRFKLSDILLKKVLLIKNTSLLDKYSFNILLLSFIFLVFSFFKINQLMFIILLFLISIISVTFKNKNLLNIKSSFNYNFFLIFIFTLIISTEIISNPKLEWDGHIWYFKALNFYENLNFFNLLETPVPAYPHLGGVLWSIVWKVSFLNYEYFGRIIYVFIYVVSILIVADKISKNTKLKIAFSITFFFLTYDKFLFTGYQEYLLFSLIIIIFNFLDKINLRKINFHQIIFITLSSYILLWVKNEGIFYFFFIILYLIYFVPTRKKLLILLLFLSLVFIRFTLFYKLTGNLDLLNLGLFNDSNSFIDFSLTNFIGEILLITQHIIIAFFKYPIWLIFFLSLFLKKMEKKEMYILYFGTVSLIFIYAAFLSSKTDLYWHVTGSLDRIVIQIFGFFMIFMSYRLKYFSKKFFKS